MTLTQRDVELVDSSCLGLAVAVGCSVVGADGDPAERDCFGGGVADVAARAVVGASADAPLFVDHCVGRLLRKNFVLSRRDMTWMGHWHLDNPPIPSPGGTDGFGMTMKMTCPDGFAVG